MKSTLLLLSSISSLFFSISCSSEKNEDATKTEPESAKWTNLLQDDSLKLWKKNKEGITPKGWKLEEGVLTLSKKKRRVTEAYSQQRNTLTSSSNSTSK